MDLELAELAGWLLFNRAGCCLIELAAGCCLPRAGCCLIAVTIAYDKLCVCAWLPNTVANYYI